MSKIFKIIKNLRSQQVVYTPKGEVIYPPNFPEIVPEDQQNPSSFIYRPPMEK